MVRPVQMTVASYSLRKISARGTGAYFVRWSVFSGSSTISFLNLAEPVAPAGREMERPTDRQFISIIQPLPSMSWPPIR